MNRTITVALLTPLSLLVSIGTSVAYKANNISRGVAFTGWVVALVLAFCVLAVCIPPAVESLADRIADRLIARLAAAAETDEESDEAAAAEL